MKNVNPFSPINLIRHMEHNLFWPLMNTNTSEATWLPLYVHSYKKFSNTNKATKYISGVYLSSGNSSLAFLSTISDANSLQITIVDTRSDQDLL